MYVFPLSCEISDDIELWEISRYTAGDFFKNTADCKTPKGLNLNQNYLQNLKSVKEQGQSVLDMSCVRSNS